MGRAGGGGGGGWTEQGSWDQFSALPSPGSFYKGVAEGEVDPAFGPLEALRLSIQTDSPVWVILSEVRQDKAGRRGTRSVPSSGMGLARWPLLTQAGSSRSS